MIVCCAHANEAALGGETVWNRCPIQLLSYMCMFLISTSNLTRSMAISLESLYTRKNLVRECVEMHRHR